ncbi:MAG: arylamine N-acetyltransferase family protein [Myxococcales bacterium]
MTKSTWVGRYLSLIGVEEEAPGLDGLRRLVRAHVQNVPFENSASLLRRHEAGSGPVRPIDPEALLAAWEARRAGGVCFEHTEMFGRLLVGRGSNASPIAGEISFPGSHQAIVVDLGGARWLVDVGNGAPFFEPFPLDGPFEIQRLGLGYRFDVDPNDPGVWIQQRAMEGGWKPYCRYLLRPQSPEDRETAYQRHHRPRDTWVTNSIVLIRSRDEEVLVFRNMDQHRYTPHGKVSSRVEDPEGWARLPGLLGLPAFPIREVASAWAAINGEPLPKGIQE